MPDTPTRNITEYMMIKKTRVFRAIVQRGEDASVVAFVAVILVAVILVASKVELNTAGVNVIDVDAFIKLEVNFLAISISELPES